MDPITSGALITGGASLIGGLLNRDAQNSANQANAQNQRDFAKFGIRWKVEDAKAAGIHPLAALGAQTHSFSPSSQPVTAMGDALNSMGQDIGRAVSQTKTQEEKTLNALQIAGYEKDLQGKELDNQIKAKQLQNLSLTSPSFPGGENFMPGQGNTPLVKINPSERVASATGRPAQEAGWVPDVGYARTDKGLTPVPSKDVKERIEDQMIPELMWAARNYVLPNLHAGTPPPKHMLPDGALSWRWNYATQEYRPFYGESQHLDKFRQKQSIRARHRR